MEKDINDIITSYREIKESSYYPFGEKKINSENFIRNKKEIEIEFKSLERKIKEYDNPKELAEKFKENVLLSINILMEFIDKSTSDSPLDRNQGMIIENFVFGKIAGVIRNSLKRYHGVSYPSFYYKPGGDFDKTELKELLEDFRSALNKEFQSYFELELCVDKYLEEIKILWKKENRNIIEAS